MTLAGLKPHWAVLLIAAVAGCGGNSKSNTPPVVDPQAAAWEAAVTKATAAVQSMTLEEKMALVEGLARPSGDTHASAGYIPGLTVQSSGLVIPAQYLCDGPNGVGNSNVGVTRYPTGITVAATWDKALAKAYGEALGAEWFGKGCTHGLAPGMNIIRLPSAGRSGEYYSEDPFLTGQIATNEVDGIQGQHVVATVKHFALNNQEVARDGTDVVASERTIHEIYLPAFEQAIAHGGAGAVMCSYNRVRGDYVCQSPYLLKQVLREGLGFKGVVMSDWFANHNSAATSINAGLDMDMPGSGMLGGMGAIYTPAALRSALEAGTITEAQISDMATHVLAPMYKVGTFDQTWSIQSDVSTDEHKQLAEDLSAAGTVLLKNAGDVLPLSKSDTQLRLAVIGGAASDHPQTGLAGSGTVQSSEAVVTALAGIQARAAGQVTYYPGSTGTGTLPLLSTTNATLTTSATGGADGFLVDYTDAEGGAIAGAESNVLTEISQGAAPFFDIYSFATRWPGVLASGTLPGWRADFNTYLTVDSDGSYEFNLLGSARVQLFIDGAYVGGIDTAFMEQSATFEAYLTAGVPHHLELKYDTDPWLYYPAFYFGGVVGPTVSLRWNPDGNSIDQAVAGAAEADVAIVVVSDSESEGVDHPVYLPANQDELVRRVAAVAKKTVVILNTGSGLVLPWADRVDAIVENWYGGQRMGTALAGILFGDVNPSGHTVVTFPRSAEQWYARDVSQYPGVRRAGDTFLSASYDEGILVGYRWFDQNRIEPLFPFGHGLSYTTFAYSDLKVSASKGDGSAVTVTVKITNTGSRSGAEVAQLYLGFPDYAGEPPQQLKGFEKVTLDPGASATVEFSLDARAFSYWDEASGGWKKAVGSFPLYVGASSRDVRLTGSYTVK